MADRIIKVRIPLGRSRPDLSSTTRLSFADDPQYADVALYIDTGRIDIVYGYPVAMAEDARATSVPHGTARWGRHSGRLLALTVTAHQLLEWIEVRGTEEAFMHIWAETVGEAVRAAEGQAIEIGRMNAQAARLHTTQLLAPWMVDHLAKLRRDRNSGTDFS